MDGIYSKSMESVKLPEPLFHKFPLERAIRERRSLREFSSREVSLQELSNLLFSAQGITDSINGFRAAPSAGALYPLTIYLLWKDALWEYIPAEHSLLKIREDRVIQRKVYQACLYQEWVLNAPLVFIFCAEYKKTAIKYGKRAWRYIYLEAGHACENLLLEATSLGMGGVPVGAFDDEGLKRVLGISLSPIYVVPVGYPG